MMSYYRNSNGIVPTHEWVPKSWIHIENPTESERFYAIEKLGVPVSFLNDLEDIDERPRIEVENNWYLIVLRIPYRTNSEHLPFSTAPLGIIFKDEVFLTYCQIETEMVRDFSLYSIRKSIGYKDYFDLVLKLILSSSVWFLKYLKQINYKIKAAEFELEKSIKNEELQRLLQIEKCLVYFTTSLKGNDILINRIKNLKVEKANYDEELIEDVEIEMKQAQETTNIYSDILSGMMDAYASVISNNLNVIMKQLTSISIILMIPTLIASLYGMNVPNSLENNRFGFWLVILFSALLSLIGVILFKRKNWF